LFPPILAHDYPGSLDELAPAILAAIILIYLVGLAVMDYFRGRQQK